MEAEMVPQTVQSSGRKKKKKKRKKKTSQGESTQENPDQNDNIDKERDSGLRVTAENSGTQHFNNLATNLEAVEAAAKHSDDDLERKSEESKGKESSLESMTAGASVAGDVATIIEGISEETLMKPTPNKSKQNIYEGDVLSEKIPEASSESKNEKISAGSEADTSLETPKKKRKKKKKKTIGILLSNMDLTESPNNSDKEKNDAKTEVEKQTCDNKEGKFMQDDLNELSFDDSVLFDKNTKERNNFSKVITMMYGLGLNTLRKLFNDIHPKWSNKPDDAKNMDTGRMTLLPHQSADFNTGDVNKWDISLITTVLLYSKKCYKELSKKKGFEDAIRSIKDQKNKISHRDSEKMTDDEFQQAWSTVSKSLETIGTSRTEIEKISEEDDILERGKKWIDLFRQERAASSVLQSQVDRIDKKVHDIDIGMQKLVSVLSSQDDGKDDRYPQQQIEARNFTEWRQFCDNVKNFDHRSNNYILITDKMPPEDLKHFSVLRNVPWKIVLDFDPSSEEHGMYHDFVTKEGRSSLFDMVTPDEIRRQHSNLSRSIELLKTKWLFVKGREKDDLPSSGIQTVNDWKSSSLKHVSRFFTCCADPGKLDKHKPLICVILPFQKGTSPYLKMTLERLGESFDEFHRQFVAVNHQDISEIQSGCENIRITDLSPSDLNSGLEDLLKIPSGKSYKLPSFQSNLTVKLPNDHFIYLQQYLDVLYVGCEDLPTDTDDESKLEDVLNKHKKSFLSGNWISFVSLSDNHDARRKLAEEIRCHIQRVLDQGPAHSTIVEICHSPGTGGTTIARRVLWDLHEMYPCAIVRFENCKHDFDDDNRYIDRLADRIGDVYQTCKTNPLILLDGKHNRIESFSNKLVRALNGLGKKAVLLRCVHRSTGTKEFDPETTDVNARFYVEVNLSRTDLNQFKEKYKDYIAEFEKERQLSRVFHFPLLAMLKGLKGFSSKLRQIVYESFDDMDGLQKEVAMLVAFIQHYTGQETPAFLLYKVFKDKGDRVITYEEINHELFTEQLLNLMVPEKPSKKVSQEHASRIPQKYSLQHPQVADMVLQRYYTTQKRDVLSYTREFLEFPILHDDELWYIVDDLFLKRRPVPKARFSYLFEDLTHLNAREAAEIFSTLAEKTSDAVVFAHAALFHSKQNQKDSFRHAKDLIDRAFECDNFKARSRIIHDRQGQVLLGEMRFLLKKDKINSIDHLEMLANAAIQSFKKAENSPPTFANPLMGEVKVWIACIDWITKNECDGDTDKAFEFITSTAPPFFRNCISNSFNLLDFVSDIVKKETYLPEPAETQDQANKLRLSLLKTFNKGKAPEKRKKDHDVIQACKALCSPKQFPKCSQFELKCLQVHYILGSVEQVVESLQRDQVEFLLNLLQDLVFTNRRRRVCMAYHLMRVSLLVPGQNHFSLDKGLKVAERWIEESEFDPQPYFYQMMIYFLKILDGDIVRCRDNYNTALQKCREISKNHCRRSAPSHFLKKTGDGMDRLMTRSSLLEGEPEYRKQLVEFWTIKSRKKLLECSGRIRHRQGKHVYIELLQGNIELYVRQSTDIGKVDRDFTPGSMVYFVVSFNLKGPVANGITFEKHETDH